MSYILIYGLLVINVHLLTCENGFNALVDEMLINLNEDINVKSMCNISLHDLQFKVSHSLFYLFPMDVEVDAKGGSIAKICSLKRTGDVTLQGLQNDTISLGLNLGLGSLSIYFSDVEAWALAGLYTDDFGTLYATASDNSIYVDISLTYPRTLACSTTLESLSVHLGGLKIWLNGNQDADTEKTANTDLKKFNDKINSAIETKLLFILKEYDICNKIILI